MLLKVPDEWVICTSHGQGEGNPSLARACLGDMCRGKDFAPFAIRSIAGKDGKVPTYEEFKEIIVEGMATGFPSLKLEWYEGHPQ